MACETRGAFHSIVAARIGCSRGMLGKIIMKRWTSSGAVATMAGTSWRDSIVIPPPTANCDMMGLTTPIAEYSHSLGEAVIGGFEVYWAGPSAPPTRVFFCVFSLGRGR